MIDIELLKAWALFRGYEVDAGVYRNDAGSEPTMEPSVNIYFGTTTDGLHGWLAHHEVLAIITKNCIVLRAYCLEYCNIEEYLTYTPDGITLVQLQEWLERNVRTRKGQCDITKRSYRGDK
jgi:hypothetical protein